MCLSRKSILPVERNRGCPYLTEHAAFEPAAVPVMPSSTLPSSTTDRDAPSARPALERLRAQVNRAADEIERLRAENRRLQERVETLEQRPDVSQDEAFITLDDPEALRRQIQDFIDTIDAYLDEPTPEPDDAE